jgi:hypothetical protein
VEEFSVEALPPTLRVVTFGGIVSEFLVLIGRFGVFLEICSLGSLCWFLGAWRRSRQLWSVRLGLFQGRIDAPKILALVLVLVLVLRIASRSCGSVSGSGFLRCVSRSWVLDLGSGLWCCWVECLVRGCSRSFRFWVLGSGFCSSSEFCVLIVVPVDIFEFLPRKKRLDEL